MAYTIGTCVLIAQRTFPDIQTQRGIQIANIVHREILAQMPEAQRDLMLTIVPVSGQYEYALDATTGETGFQIDFCSYVDGNGKAWPVSGTTVESLDRKTPKKTWRQDAPAASWSGGQTVSYYTSTAFLNGQNTNVVGFYPAPGFSGGTIYCYGSYLQAIDLVSSSLCLPALLSSQVYIDGILYYAARELRIEQAGAFKAAYEEQITLNQHFIRTRNADNRGSSADDVNPRGMAQRSGAYPSEPNPS